MVKCRYQRKPFKPVNPERFREMRLLSGLTRLQAARLLFVTLRTIQYWESGKIKIPYAAFKLLRIHTGYELPGIAWKGFMLLGDTLDNPGRKKRLGERFKAFVGYFRDGCPLAQGV